MFIDSTSLKVLLKDLGLTSVSRRISALSLTASLRNLSSYNIVVIAKGSFGDAYYAFYILPSIRYVISNAKLNSLYNSIKDINGEGEEGSSSFEEGLEGASEEDGQVPEESEPTDKGDGQL